MFFVGILWLLCVALFVQNNCVTLDTLSHDGNEDLSHTVVSHITHWNCSGGLT